MRRDADRSGAAREAASAVRRDPRDSAAALSELVACCRTADGRDLCGGLFADRAPLYAALEAGTPKVRKNAARLLGAMKSPRDEDALLGALGREGTCFVIPSLILALGACGGRKAAEALEAYAFPGEDTPENEKHRAEAESARRKALDRLHGGEAVTGPRKLAQPRTMLLVSPEGFSDVLCEELEELSIPHRAHPEGALVRTDEPERAFLARCFAELLYPVRKDVPIDPKAIAEACAGQLGLPYRIELRGYEGDRKELLEGIAAAVGGENSVSRYALELRVECAGAACRLSVKPCYLTDRRFVYREKAIPASMQPALAACIVRYTSRFIENGPEEPSVLDACCGSGTLLIEREVFSPVGSLLGVDLSRDALLAAEANVRAAKSGAKLIGKDLTKFMPREPVDEIYMNLPFGNRVGSHENNRALYATLAARLPDWLRKGGIAALYTMEYDLLDRCLKREGRLRLLNRRRTEAGGLRPWLFIVRREG